MVKKALFLIATLVLLGFMAIIYPHFNMKKKPEALVAQAEISQSPDTRDYFAPLTDPEKNDIRFIITTLANKSTLNLLFYKKALNEAGNRTGKIHPLKFLLFVFSDPQLKQAVKRIHGTPWRRYVDGMARNLATSAQRNNIKQSYIEDFTAKLRLKPALLSPFIENQQWSQFINITRDNLN